MAKTVFLNFFCSFSFFFRFLDKCLSLLLLAFCFASIWIRYSIGGTDFVLDFCAFVIIKNLINCSSFLVQVVCKSFFHDLALSIFFLILISGFSMIFLNNSCFDEVNLADIFISGSQLMTKLDQIFYHILTDLIFLFLLFLFYGFVSR